MKTIKIAYLCLSLPMLVLMLDNSQIYLNDFRTIWEALHAAVLALTHPHSRLSTQNARQCGPLWPWMHSAHQSKCSGRAILMRKLGVTENTTLESTGISAVMELQNEWPMSIFHSYSFFAIVATDCAFPSSFRRTYVLIFSSAFDIVVTAPELFTRLSLCLDQDYDSILQRQYLCFTGKADLHWRAAPHSAWQRRSHSGYEYSFIKVYCFWNMAVRRIYVGHDTTVGRDQSKWWDFLIWNTILELRYASQWVLADPYLSTKHLRIYSVVYENEDEHELEYLVYCEDLSRHGTYWNGSLIGRGNGGFLLSNGDKLRLSRQTTFCFVVPDASTQSNHFDLTQESEMAVSTQQLNILQI